MCSFVLNIYELIVVSNMTAP